MKISLNWLQDYFPGPLETQAAADVLTFGGLNVEVIEKHGDDFVIDVEVTSNRGDCLSHIGIARELAALMNREFRDVSPKAAESSEPASHAVTVGIEAPDLCPHYTARLIRGVRIGPSPAWMAQRLEAIGVRPINNVVDVTNYVLFEMGQPLHAFDFAKIGGGRISVRRAAVGEKLTAIDGRERPLRTDMLVIADASRPVALAGVMGGSESEVSPSTVDVLLESARFDPLSIRKTARALAMKSDSSYRFERGIDPALPLRASLRAAQLILETAGGSLLGGVVEAGQNGAMPKKLALRLPRLKQLLGVEFPADVVVGVLGRLGLSPVLSGDRIECTIPTFRLDLNIEVDLIEEVARVVGYDKIPTRDEISIRLTPPELATKTVNAVRHMLVAGGYFESITVSFVTDNLAGDFIPADSSLGAQPRTDATVRKADARLRPSLLPGLLESVRRNENVGTFGAKLFEIGSAFSGDPAGRVKETRLVGLVGSGDVREVRGVVESLLQKLDADRPVKIVPAARSGFGKSGCGRIEWGGTPIGFLGKIDRAVADKLSLRDLPAAAELEIVPLLHGALHVPQLKPLARFPAVRRDLSFVFGEEIRYDKLDELIRGIKPENLEDIEYVTTYRGKQVDAGQKSVTITLIFRSASGTLTSEQVETAVARVVAEARQKLGATLRA